MDVELEERCTEMVVACFYLLFRYSPRMTEENYHEAFCKLSKQRRRGHGGTYYCVSDVNEFQSSVQAFILCDAGHGVVIVHPCFVRTVVWVSTQSLAKTRVVKPFGRKKIIYCRRGNVLAELHDPLNKTEDPRCLKFIYKDHHNLISAL